MIGSRSSCPQGSSSFSSSKGSSGEEFESRDWDRGGDGVGVWGIPETGLGCGVKTSSGEDCTNPSGRSNSGALEREGSVAGEAGKGEMSEVLRLKPQGWVVSFLRAPPKRKLRAFSL